MRKYAIKGISLRSLKEHQDLYPRFEIKSMPDPASGFKSFKLVVLDKETGTPLNPSEIQYFIEKIAAPAITNGNVEYVFQDE